MQVASLVDSLVGQASSRPGSRRAFPHLVYIYLSTNLSLARSPAPCMPQRGLLLSFRLSVGVDSGRRQPLRRSHHCTLRWGGRESTSSFGSVWQGCAYGGMKHGVRLTPREDLDPRRWAGPSGSKNLCIRPLLHDRNCFCSTTSTRRSYKRVRRCVALHCISSHRTVSHRVPLHPIPGRTESCSLRSVSLSRLGSALQQSSLMR